jgi:hypothetical protein
LFGITALLTFVPWPSKLDDRWAWETLWPKIVQWQIFQHKIGIILPSAHGPF